MAFATKSRLGKAEDHLKAARAYLKEAARISAQTARQRDQWVKKMQAMSERSRKEHDAWVKEVRELMKRVKMPRAEEDLIIYNFHIRS